MTRNARFPAFVLWTLVCAVPIWAQDRSGWRTGVDIQEGVRGSIVGTVADWERWTDMRLPDSGSYVVPGALQPVVIDRLADEGRYEDPNVWMRHTVN